MKRLLVLLVWLAAAAACTRSGRPVVGQALQQTGKEYVDPYYFRNTSTNWKVIWFIGPGHCPFIRPTAAALGIEKIQLTDPDTHEEFLMRSPLYYVWLFPIERVFGVNSNRVSQPARPRTTGAGQVAGPGGRGIGSAPPAGAPTTAAGRSAASKITEKGVPEGATLILTPEQTATQPTTPRTLGATPSGVPTRTGATQQTQPGVGRPRIAPPEAANP